MLSQGVSLCSSLLTNVSHYKGLRQSCGPTPAFLLPYFVTICNGKRFSSHIFYLTPGGPGRDFLGKKEQQLAVLLQQDVAALVDEIGPLPLLLPSPVRQCREFFAGRSRRLRAGISSTGGRDRSAKNLLD